MTAQKSSRKTAVDRPAGANEGLPESSSRTHSGASAAGAASVPAGVAGGDPADLLLVCIQHPFQSQHVFSLIANVLVPCADGNPQHLWQLQTVLEMNPPRFFEGWATAGSFTLDLKVNASLAASDGAWGGIERTGTAAGTCRMVVMRDAKNEVSFSLASVAVQAAEVRLTWPDEHRHLNADVSFALNGSAGLTAAAVAVVSQRPWARLVAGSNAPTKGLAFDAKWRSNLDDGDDAVAAAGAWAFAVMTPDAYAAFCRQRGLAEQVV